MICHRYSRFVPVVTVLLGQVLSVKYQVLTWFVPVVPVVPVFSVSRSKPFLMNFVFRKIELKKVVQVVQVVQIDSKPVAMRSVACPSTRNLLVQNWYKWYSALSRAGGLTVGRYQPSLAIGSY